MSCYLIKVENGHKVARSITSEEEYKQLRGSNEQKANLRLARAGNDAAKRRLVQFNYSGHYPQGVVKGMKLPSGAFGFDMDEPEAFAKAAKLLLKEPDKYGRLLKGKCWKNVKDTETRNCRKGRTKRTSIMSLGRKNSRRILKGF